VSQVLISVHVHAIAHESTSLQVHIMSHVQIVSHVVASLHVSTFAGSLGDVVELVNEVHVLVSELESDSVHDRYLSAFSRVI
jgi:hypothetical protein